ncbi:MAG: hypothetical protein FJZ11_02650 [Candidatus Omnitrophica bacterium]|nr:hypothetical protein [Candidatus Omnitrophota bacterium]MBM3251668.1 hypothetical protein [Candidatus Omnitrophota bacterium]
MIKNTKDYLRQQEQERKNYLSKLTYRRSALIMEKFLVSNLILELNFSDDDYPISLSKLVKKQ